MINQYLTSKDTKLCDEAVHLLFSTNRWEMKEYIHSKISEGVSLVCDRYAYSGVAYSSAKGLDTEWCANPDRGLPHPDLVLFINTKIDEIVQRSGFGEERYEKAEFQSKVYDAFLKLESIEPNWTNIESSGKDVDEIHSMITEIVMKTFESIDENETDIPDSLFM